MKKITGKEPGKSQALLPAVLLCALVLAACGPAKDTETVSVPDTVNDTVNTGPASQAASEAPETLPADNAAEETLNGNVEEISASSFKVSEIYTEDLGDGGLAAVSPVNPDPADFITVNFTEDTVFIIRSSSDNGITSSDSEATAADLERGRSVVITGIRNQSVFNAKEVVLYHFN